jgi:hypothetical protein
MHYSLMALDARDPAALTTIITAVFDVIDELPPIFVIFITKRHFFGQIRQLRRAIQAISSMAKTDSTDLGLSGTRLLFTKWL